MDTSAPTWPAPELESDQKQGEGPVGPAPPTAAEDANLAEDTPTAPGDEFLPTKYDAEIDEVKRDIAALQASAHYLHAI